VSHSERALPLEGLIRIERLQDSSETNVGREVTMKRAAEKSPDETELVSTAIGKSGEVMSFLPDAVARLN
jgi:hypothetical protein